MIQSTRIAVTFVPLILAGCSVSGGQVSPTKTSSSTSTTGASWIRISKNVPAIGETSTAGQIAAYVAYYQRKGYTVTLDQRTFSPNGIIKTFRFAAKRHTRTDQSSANASISASSSTVTVTTSESGSPGS